MKRCGLLIEMESGYVKLSIPVISSTTGVDWPWYTGSCSSRHRTPKGTAASREGATSTRSRGTYHAPVAVCMRMGSITNRPARRASTMMRASTTSSGPESSMGTSSTAIPGGSGGSVMLTSCGAVCSRITGTENCSPTVTANLLGPGSDSMRSWGISVSSTCAPTGSVANRSTSSMPGRSAGRKV